MQVKLSAGFVRKAPVPSKGRVIYWDLKLPSFGLLVIASGHRSFVVQYRARGVSRRYTMRADVLALNDARRQARRILGEAANGGDPVSERRKMRLAEVAKRRRARKPLEPKYAAF